MKRSIGLSLAIMCTAIGSAYAMMPVKKTQNVTVFLDGTKLCDETLKFKLTGRSADNFSTTTQNNAGKKKISEATNGLNNAVQEMLRSCPVLSLVTAKGMVAKDIVYSAVAEKSTGWAVKAKGSVSSSGSLTGAVTNDDVGAKSDYAADTSFLKATEVVAKLKDNPYLCLNYEKKSNSCQAFSHYKNLGNANISVNARNLMDNKGAEELYKYDIALKDGFLCTNPRQIAVSIEKTDMSDGAKEGFVSLLKERLHNRGTELCYGFHSLGNEVLTDTFDAKGRQISTTSTVTFMNTAPKLRMDD